MKKILLTRSADENALIRKQLFNNQLNIIECCLIKYFQSKLNLTEQLRTYSNIIITSKYATKIIVENSHNIKNSIQFWVVGKISAKILANAGLEVKYIAHNVRDLIKNLPLVDLKQYIYISSNIITKNMPKGVKREIIYHVKYKNNLTKGEIKQFEMGLDYILLYSYNCAKVLIKLLLRYNLLESLKDVNIVVLSKNIAKIIRLYFKNVIYCEDDKHNNIIELLIEDINFGSSK